jgi:hypothetical protein
MQAGGSCVTAGRPRQVGGEVRCLGGAHARLVRVGIVFVGGGRHKLAQQTPEHESPRTTALYDRRDDEVAVDEVERIRI